MLSLALRRPSGGKKWSLLVKKLTIQDLKRGETEGMEGGTSMWSTASLGEAVSGNVTD